MRLHTHNRHKRHFVENAYVYKRNASRGGKITRPRVSSSQHFVLRKIRSYTKVSSPCHFVYEMQSIRVRNAHFVYENSVDFHFVDDHFVSKASKLSGDEFRTTKCCLKLSCRIRNASISYTKFVYTKLSCTQLLAYTKVSCTYTKLSCTVNESFVYVHESFV